LPFHGILAQLLSSTNGSIAAIFLDWEGETVALVTAHDLEQDELKALGAYQGIFLKQLRGVCSDMNVGAPQRFKIEFTNRKVLICDVKDGYFVVMLVGSETNEGEAWHHLAHVRQDLLEEM
jgi:predicted regulator of Ras-like GTPase activity (Roadblock/LC7/MglB family)